MLHGNIELSADGNSYIRTGAIAGTNHGQILNCYANTNVSANGENNIVMGGLAATGNGTIENSYYYGNLKSSKSIGIYCGGIVASSGNGFITSCYSLANIELDGEHTSFINVGGISGENLAEVTNSYSCAKINCNRDIDVNIGYLIGKNNTNATITGGYLKREKYVGIGDLNQGINQTVEYNSTDQIPTILSVINTENVFKEDTNNINNKYPIFQWQ